METARCRWLVFVVIIATGCERRDAVTSGQPAESVPIAVASDGDDASEDGAIGPGETVRLLHERRGACDYGKMKSLLAPEHREPVCMLVQAVDELVVANGALQRAIREHIGEGSATAFRRRDQVANILGPLSRDVAVIDQTVTGDTAVVRIQVAERVPLEEVHLRRDSGVWHVVTDDPIPGLAEEVRNLAGAAHRVRKELNHRPLTIEQVDERLDMWQAPALKRMSNLMAQAESERNQPGSTE